MSQAERISRIHYLLRSKGQFTTKQIQDEFEVARNTVMSDVTLMRDRLRAPIVFDPKKAAYVYDKGQDDPWDYHDSFDLPGFWVSRAEAYGMLTLLNLSSQLDPGLLYPSVYPLRGVLKKLLVTRMTMRGYHKKVVVDLPICMLVKRGLPRTYPKHYSVVRWFWHNWIRRTSQFCARSSASFSSRQAGGLNTSTARMTP